MIRYTVVWHDDALNQLAQLWVNAQNRESVTLAVSAADQHLANDAASKGIAVEGGLRQVVVPPLRLLFSVSDSDRMVKVLDVTSA